MELPKAVQNIIHILERNGYEAYAVGGCVRDLLLHRSPKDWDVTTSAPPSEIKRIFHRTVDTGIQHGTVTVLMEGTGYEVTTYRVDGAYADFRHPSEVRFTSALSEDLKRRDFTINAMAYNDQKGLVDLFHGREDLEKGVIRAVGDPEARFTEDALRILRAFRFSAQLGFSIEEKTYKAAEKLVGNLVYISRERVREELVKLLTSGHPDRITELAHIGALNDVIPGYPKDDRVLVRTLSNLKTLPVLRLSGLLYYCAPNAAERAKNAERVLTELRFDNTTKRDVTKLLSLSDLPTEGLDENGFSRPPSPAAARRVLCRSGRELFRELLELMYEFSGWDPYFLEMERVADDALARGECTTISELALTGNDLLTLGVSPGRAVGETLNRLLQEVLEIPEKNTKETLSLLVKEWLDK